MSHEASAWAFRQELPAKLKIVLLALADQAHPQTGHVCYGRRDAKFLAEKSCCGARTFFRYLAVLERNGYLERESGKAKGHESEYYLQLERESTEFGKLNWRAVPNEVQPQDIGSAKTDVENTAGENWHTPCATKVAESESLESTKEHRPADEKPKIGFSRQAQDVERAKAATELNPPRGPVFVYEGTPAWTAWMAYRRSIGRPINTSYRGEGEHRGKTGRHFSSLFPPKSPATGPPLAPDGVNEQAAKEFSELAK